MSESDARGKKDLMDAIAEFKKVALEAAKNKPKPPTRHLVPIQVDRAALERLRDVNARMIAEVSLDPQERPPGVFQALVTEFIVETRKVLRLES